MPLRYQRGHLRCVKRNSGNFLWRESLGGRRIAKREFAGHFAERF